MSQRRAFCATHAAEHNLAAADLAQHQKKLALETAAASREAYKSETPELPYPPGQDIHTYEERIAAIRGAGFPDNAEVKPIDMVSFLVKHAPTKRVCALVEERHWPRKDVTVDGWSFVTQQGRTLLTLELQVWERPRRAAGWDDPADMVGARLWVNTKLTWSTAMAIRDQVLEWRRRNPPPPRRS